MNMSPSLIELATALFQFLKHSLWVVLIKNHLLDFVHYIDVKKLILGA